MKPALFARTDNDRVAKNAGAEIFAAMAALRTKTACMADRDLNAAKPNCFCVQTSASASRCTLTPISDQFIRFMLASGATMQIHFIDIIAIGDVESAARCLKDEHLAQRRWISEMSQLGGTISLEQDTPELARNYEQAGIVQFHHGKLLIGPLALKAGEHVLDIGTGTGRLAEFVAGLVGPQGRVIGIDPLESRVDIARLRQSKTLTFETGRAEDLSCFGDRQFDAVYLNSVFHWIAEKDRALREIHRVLKPGGRLGLNVQDPSRPHESRVFLRTAILQSGLGDRHPESNPVLGAIDEELKALFATAGFVDYRSDLRSLVDVHSDADSLLKWSEASAFGNFLDGFTRSESDQVRVAFARLVETKRAPEGLRLERDLRFAFARKAPFPIDARGSHS
jgi:SAM-dependent methyltransferase